MILPCNVFDLDTRKGRGMEMKLKRMRGAAVDVLMIGGALLVSVGAGMYSVPIGLITGGVLSIIGAVVVARGGG